MGGERRYREERWERDGERDTRGEGERGGQERGMGVELLLLLYFDVISFQLFQCCCPVHFFVDC